MTRVKICGITTAEDRNAAVIAGADALGFTVNVSVDTPREITPDQATSLVAAVPPFVTSVLVTMLDSLDAAVELVEEIGVDAVQLHGTMSPESLVELRDRAGVQVIKAVDSAHPETAQRYDPVVDALLVDSTREDGAGGTGQTHDWVATRTLRESVSVPVILAGGLTPGNVAEAVQTVDPYAVDVASGVERSGGRKDHEAVTAFIANATRPLEVSR